MSTEGDVEEEVSQQPVTEKSEEVSELHSLEVTENNTNESQIEEVLGLTIAMVYVLAESGNENQTEFLIRNVFLTSDVIEELSEFKIQLYFGVIERANSYVDIKTSQQFKDYLFALEQLWSQWVAIIDTDVKHSQHMLVLKELSEEFGFHSTKFRQFLKRISFTIKGLELICADCAKQSTDFGDIFNSDFVLQTLTEVYVNYTEVSDRLTDRLNQIRHLFEK